MQLPAGEITFLFTDIEGSTRLLQRLGEGYRRVLEKHAQLIRSAVAAYGGVEINTFGDGFFIAFPSAARAVEAAVAAQQALGTWPWPEGGWVRVRMGLHTGMAEATGDDYVGLDVHRTARICAAAHGGQILVSAAVRAALGSDLPESLTLHSLGRHRLKDLQEPQHLLQVVVPGLLNDFPPPRSLDARPHNLPSEVTDFVGRKAELEEAKQLLAASRMLTFLGPGGTGKTRLALRVAGEVLSEYDDGVFFVPLASIRDPRIVSAAIAQGLGIRDSGARSIDEVLAEHCEPRKLLLVLDNFEQVVEAASGVGALLAAAPRLKVLDTSRERLRLRGEQVFEVPPLALPSERTADLERLARVEAVELFVRRAQAMDPSFTLSSRNAPAVVRIVTAVEGLPLAIELAAARCRLMPPEMLAQRLEQRFQVLRGGPRDLPARHQALRDTIAWSYDLLSRSEQALLRRLGVFSGGFTLEPLEEVAAGDPVEDVVEAVAALVDKSLLRSRAPHGEGRFRMLEAIREFALEELAAAGETRQVAERHAAYYLAMAEEAEPHLTRPEQGITVDRLAADHDNLRVALRFCLDTGDIERGLRLGSAVWRFWQASGQLQEGRRWLEELLARPAAASTRAKGLVALAGLVYWQGDYETAIAHYEQALALYRTLGDPVAEADTVCALSTSWTWHGDALTGGRLAEQALAMFETLGAREKVGTALMAQGFARWMQNDLAGARPLWERSLAIAREIGDFVEAAVKRLAIASIDFNLGRRDQALRDALEALEELVELKNVTFTIMALDWVAALAVHRDPEAGTRLAGAASALRTALGGGMRPEASGLESARTVAARQLDAETLERAWAAGQEIPLDEAIAFARQLTGALLLPAAAAGTPGAEVRFPADTTGYPDSRSHADIDPLA